MTYQARTGDRLGILKFTCKTGGHYILKTHNYSYQGSQIVKKMRFKTLLMNQGIRFLMAFVSAAVPCVCPYFSLRQCHLLIAAVLKLFSSPPPPASTLIFTYRGRPREIILDILTAPSQDAVKSGCTQGGMCIEIGREGEGSLQYVERGGEE